MHNISHCLNWIQEGVKTHFTCHDILCPLPPILGYELVFMQITLAFRRECIYKKIKWSCYRPGVAQRVGRDISLLFHDRGTRRGWVVSSMPRPHFTHLYFCFSFLLCMHLYFYSQHHRSYSAIMKYMLTI